MNHEYQKENFTISTDNSRLQIDVIQKFLVEDSYWASTRTLEQTQLAIENSLCFGINCMVEAK